MDDCVKAIFILEKMTVTIGIYNSWLGGIELGIRKCLPDSKILWEIPQSSELAYLNPFSVFGDTHPVDLFWLNLPDESHFQKVVKYIIRSLPKTIVTVGLRNIINTREYSDYIELLKTLGYCVHADIYDASYYNVPQNRVRLVVRAVYDEYDQYEKLPPMKKNKPTGWFSVLKDILLELPECGLAKNQQRELNGKIPLGVLVKRYDISHCLTVRKPREPAFTTIYYKTTKVLNVIDFDGIVRHCDKRAMKRLQGLPDNHRIPQKKFLYYLSRTTPPNFAYHIVKSISSFIGDN